MKDENWKEILSKLSYDELKRANAFITDLIKKAESTNHSESSPKFSLESDGTDSQKEIEKPIQQEQLLPNGKTPIVIFPPTADDCDNRHEKRFKMEVNGYCSVIKKGQIDLFLTDLTIKIKDISQHGIHFIIDKHIPPSSILIIKFMLTPPKPDKSVYHNPLKKIYVEVRRVREFSTNKGIFYDVGAVSIDSEKIDEIQQECELHEQIKHRVSMKNDIKILIVSYKESDTKRIGDMLVDCGYNVNKAAQIPAAIASLRKKKPNVVITDFDLVKINNYELINTIKSEFTDVGLIVEVATIDEWLEVLVFGADDYVLKNHVDKDLCVVVENVLTKLFFKTMYESQLGKEPEKGSLILVLCGNEEYRNLFCQLPVKEEKRFYFVHNTETAWSVLKSLKIDCVFIDTGVTGDDGCSFLRKLRMEYPEISITVMSKNLQERAIQLINGANNFIPEPIISQEYLPYWSQLVF